MSPPTSSGSPNILVWLITAAVAALAMANAVSAWWTDAVWMPSDRGLWVTRLPRAADPMTFYLVLVVVPALAAYMIWHLWRRRRRGSNR